MDWCFKIISLSKWSLNRLLFIKKRPKTLWKAILRKVEEVYGFDNCRLNWFTANFVIKSKLNPIMYLIKTVLLICLRNNSYFIEIKYKFIWFNPILVGFSFIWKILILIGIAVPLIQLLVVVLLKDFIDDHLFITLITINHHYYLTTFIRKIINIKQRQQQQCHQQIVVEVLVQLPFSITLMEQWILKGRLLQHCKGFYYYHYLNLLYY